MSTTKGHTLKVRVTEAELAAIDSARGLVTRSAYLRSLLPTASDFVLTPGATSDAVLVRPANTPAGKPTVEPHKHTWRRYSNVMDDCECGETRPHTAGTR